MSRLRPLASTALALAVVAAWLPAAAQPLDPVDPEEPAERAVSQSELGEDSPDPVDPSQAQEGELPSGKWGMVGALRQNIGELGSSYGFGWLWGLEAGYQPTRPGEAFSFGLSWSALFGRFAAENASLPDDPLSVLEMSFGTRVRTALGEEAPRFLVGSAGVTVLRTSAPIPPDDDRLYFGGYAGFGVEQYVGNMLVGLDARFGLLGSGPTGLTLLASVSWGSP
jgi:hypothetical protein